MNEEDRKIIQNPNRWVRWPFLCVKRYTQDENIPEVGVLADLKDGLTFYAGANIWDDEWWKKVEPVKVTVEDLEKEGWYLD